MSGAFVLVLQHKDINASLFVERLKVKPASALCFLPYRGLKGIKTGGINEEEGGNAWRPQSEMVNLCDGGEGACCADWLFGRADSVLLAFCLWRICSLM